ncbi:UDP-glucose dehydrogenase family protein [Cellulomonas fengjieae]|uniref:UDP-glucose 6-dehydrogenase n=1 Tax=Cellulomonas fengjieae TaxID=2819978 RepID=A0ABS3SLN0_9CELL|nr:UDP-glucose/GDP-mannose dehydrogenase family protein [Cellulomonas fengjieae]MBO3086656.1 UDP-glucose/GDP-mannose dehydrogenase family protein [Cellulomonas fengjieae]MBO3100648.1 UDP-glucose/GDP-mannose dehydrogenase family protein [Cellulomonas fengjieae]QVI66496.1 UDP-glucose/GDP-mannose dehydrogenase family protein [Cellulomonas fengjieae]
MQISVIGCGYLGAVHAACMAKLGHDVVGIDVDSRKVAQLDAGEAPFYEPGLPELLAEVRATGRLRFSTDLADAAGSAVHFLCVGTPQKHGEFRADLTYVETAFAQLRPHLRPGDVVAGKSTVPVGTAESLAAQLEGTGTTLVWNPEFLREGFAVQDTLHPDRLVYGLPTDEDGEPTDAGIKARGVLDEVYARTLTDGTPLVATDYATSQLVKVAANSFLATKISFINAMAELCEATGADVTSLADAIGYDARIGRRFLNAGLGFGGGCLPKDIRAFMARAGELGVSDALSFLREVDSINMRRRVRMVDLAREVSHGSIVGKRVAVLGAAFKPDSDDVRDSPALSVAAQMQLQGAHVTVTDPQAVENARAKWPDLSFAATALEAAQDADVVLLATEWREYREIDPDALGAVVAHKRILDGRNVLEPATWRAAGWTYRALGRP